MMTALQSSLSTIAGLSALTWYLIGGIAGGVCLLCIVAVLVVLLVRRRRRQRPIDEHVDASLPSSGVERDVTDYFGGGETMSHARKASSSSSLVPREMSRKRPFMKGIVACHPDKIVKSRKGRM